MLNLKKTILSMAVMSSVLLSSATSSFAVPLSMVEEGFAKNVIYLIPDGMSQGGVTLARWVYNDGQKLHMDEITSGLMQTHNSDTIIADSAPAGTAMATGMKTQDKLVGVNPTNATLAYAKMPATEDKLKPVASVLEAAKLAGKSTGIVVTSEVQHATPADFTAHAVHRGEYTNIGEQQVYQNMDVVMGGGLAYLGLDEKGSKEIRNKYRVDGEDMLKVVQAKGYTVVKTAEEMKNATGNKIWGGFSAKALKRELDRETTQPKLAEMTKKAIDVLSKNDKGFFLMVEGSQVDWAAHANDTVGIISEIKAFDDAVGVALDFAKSNKDTVVIVATDHGNSGITIGNQETSRNYPEIPVEGFVKYLKRAGLTEEKAAKLVKDKKSTVKEAMNKLGIDDLTAEEEKTIATKEDPYDMQKAMADVVSQRSKIGYTTGGHTGEDVAIYTYAPTYNNVLTGTIDNHELALYAAKVLGLDMEKANAALFVSHKQMQDKGMNVTLDKSDQQNPKLIVKTGSGEYTVPVNKNIVWKDGKEKEFVGVTVYNGTYFYLPQSMIDYMMQ